MTAVKQILNPGQKEAFGVLQKFLDHPGPDTFVLKGYAGTGKTFLMQYLARWLEEKERQFCLLASTGRASSVLRGKTGFRARTVHGELYQFNKVEGDNEDLPEDAPEEKYGQMKLQFLLRKPDKVKRIYIVDEASMLSSEPSEESIASFGSGLLMNDFFDAAGSNKIVFVGDPCQLPPIGQPFSPALDMNWLAGQRRTAISFTLEQIERTAAENDILILATRIRHMTAQECLQKWPKLPAKGRDNVKLHDGTDQLFRKYLEKYKTAGTNGTLAIVRSNEMARSINYAFRKEIYGSENEPLKVDDILLVNRNNYKVPLANGDFIRITALAGIESKANLHFQKVKIKAIAAEDEYELLLSLDILYGMSNQFSREQTMGLMIDFSRRMKNRGIRQNTQEYKEAMMSDDYLNCIQATYGYAVTCHKAQGGEWDDVFLFLDKKMYGMPHPELFRWWYTAVTRAKRELNLENNWWIE